MVYVFRFDHDTQSHSEYDGMFTIFEERLKFFNKVNDDEPDEPLIPSIQQMPLSDEPQAALPVPVSGKVTIVIVRWSVCHWSEVLMGTTVTESVRLASLCGVVQNSPLERVTGLRCCS